MEVEKEIKKSMLEMGYQLGECTEKEKNMLKNNTGYKYCVQEIRLNEGSENPKFYRITTYVQFYFPVIKQIFSPAVTSETKILGTNYHY